ncbi:hypothetical protein NTCA1_03390 [Novosphingobium sp. TCA1]|nr:hypothetical protein NTCA1_03390 [Novosphingobium sp. TCA1]
MSILGQEQPLAGQEQDHDAFLAPSQQAAGEILAKCRTCQGNRLAQQGFAQGDGGQVARGHDQRGDRLTVQPGAVDLVGKGLRTGGIDRAKRSEAPDQTAGNDLAAIADDGTEDLRQDG